MKAKILISGIFCLFIINMNSQTNNLNKKWIVYNTVNGSLTGWHSFMDSYILDFTDAKVLKIKTLGDNEIINIPYSFNSDSGAINEDNGSPLYSILKLDSNKLSLKMGDKSTTTVNLIKLSDSTELFVSQVLNHLKKSKWYKDSNSILFTDDKYKVLNEVDTNFKIFTETDEKTKKKYKGAWLLDSYEGTILLELFSERFNHKSIYQIKVISDNLLQAISTDEKGQSLLLEFTR